MSSFDQLRQIMRGIAEQFENLWIEREFLIERLTTDHDVPRSLVDAMLETARNSPKWRNAAAQVSEQIRKVLEDKTFEIALQERDENPPSSGKPN